LAEIIIADLARRRASGEPALPRWGWSRPRRRRFKTPHHEQLEDKPHLAARAGLEAQLLREAADRLGMLHTRIAEHLAGPAGAEPC
jgi:hypothetical protein